jgi:hypothetical protein
MRKVFALVALVAAVAIPVTAAYAADLHNLDSCETSGTYHFVLNQAPGDAGDQELTVNAVNYGTSDFVVANGKVAHWTIELAGPLTGASTDGEGKLVLSDFSCKKGGGDPKKPS